MGKSGIKIEQIRRSFPNLLSNFRFYVNTLFAHLGEFDSRNLTDDILRVKVEKLVKHPMFGNPYNRFKNDWDIALIKLRVPIMFSEFISPVCLPGGRVPLIGQTGITTGWVS